MSAPRLLRPLVAGAAALALGAGAVWVGAQFAAPEQTVVATGTESVPVAAPIAVGDQPVPGGDEAPESPTTGERVVRVPGDPVDASAPLDPGTQQIVDALAASPDPGFEITVIAGDDGGGAGDDACAPRAGDAPADCPDGLRSTVLPIVADRLWGTLAAFPPNGANGGRLTGCEASALDPPEGETPFGIVANAPATFRISYWPVDGSGGSRSVEVPTPDDQRSAFDAALATVDDPADLPVIAFCLTIAGLEPGTAYAAELTGRTDVGREMWPHRIRFNSAGAPVRPSLQLTPIGENLLFASALHTAEQSLELRAFAVEGDAAPSCDGGSELWQASTADTTIAEDALLAANVLPEYSLQHSETYRVSPGVTVIVCARWFDASADATSWQRAQPLYASSIVAQSPDRLVPQLEIVDWSDDSGLELDRIEVSAATAEGAPCDALDWTIDAPLHTPATLCSAGFLADSGVRVEGDRMWDLGFAGDLVVRGRVELPSGYSEAALLVPAVDGDCRGSCPIPADRRYRLRLAGVTIDLRESWRPGGGNGLGDWGFTPPVDEAPDYLRPELPQVDTDRGWSYSTPVAGSPSVTATLDLVVDREVDYVVRISENLGESFPNCSGTGLMEARGHAIAGANRILIPDVCLGLDSRSQVEVTDASGATVVWGMFDRDAWWGPNSVVDTPTLDATLRYRVDGFIPAFSSLQHFDLVLGSTDVGLVNDYGGECTRDGILMGDGSAEVELAASTRFAFRLQFQEVNGWTETDCDDVRDGSFRSLQTVEGAFTIDELYRPDGVVITVDIPGYGTARIHLWAG